jgi:hypothetical protein
MMQHESAISWARNRKDQKALKSELQSKKVPRAIRMFMIAALAVVAAGLACGTRGVEYQLRSVDYWYGYVTSTAELSYYDY